MGLSSVMPDHILRSSHCIQMSGIHARFISAGMIDFEAWGDLAYEESIGKSMRHSAVAAGGESAVSFAIDRSRPDPAIARRRGSDLLDKQFECGFHASVHYRKSEEKSNGPA